MSSEISIIIPARYGSTRFQGKPLALIAGMSLLQRVWRIASSVCANVIIATDDARIAAHAQSFGARIAMTAAECPNGTVRTAAVLEQFPEITAALNLQGDAVLTPPWVLTSMLESLAALQHGIVTPAVLLDKQAWKTLAEEKKKTPASGTLVTCKADGTALYFSKQMIPFIRDVDKNPFPPVYRHIGLYGYTRETLMQLLSLSPSPLEEAEGLEQLRALEHGIPIQVIPVDYRSRTHASIDSPEDVARVEAIIAREGELV